MSCLPPPPLTLTKDCSSNSLVERGDDMSQEGRDDFNASPEQRTEDLVPSYINEDIKACNWNRLDSYFRKDSSLSRRQGYLVVQGENCRCSVLHMLSGCPKVPVSLINIIIEQNPAALFQKESRGGRLPLHIAVVKNASSSVVARLCEAYPAALQRPDKEGNLPLHHAAMYGSLQVLEEVLGHSTAGCGVANTRDRFPIHLVCARCFDAETPSPALVQQMIEAHPEALLKLDRFGRTPLHLAASSVQHPQWQLLQLLIQYEPQALLIRDKARKIPLQSAKKTIGGGTRGTSDLIVSSLQEATQRQRIEYPSRINQATG